MTPEGRVKKAFRDRATKHGLMCLSMMAFGARGLPDVLVLIPGGRVCWVEFKAVGGRLSPYQERMIEKLRGLNFRVETIWTTEDARTLADEFGEWA